MDHYAPMQHFWEHQLCDLLPYVICCKGSQPNCRAYYHRRPSHNGTGYDSTPPGMIRYSLNGT